MAFFNPHKVDFNYDTRMIDAAGAVGKSLYEIYKDNVAKNQNQARLDETNRANLMSEYLRGQKNYETARHNQTTEAETAKKNAFDQDLGLKNFYSTDSLRRAQINNLYADNARQNAQLQWNMSQAQEKAQAEQEKQAGIDMAWYNAGQQGGQFGELPAGLSDADKRNLGRQYRLQIEAQGGINKAQEPILKQQEAQQKQQEAKRNDKFLLISLSKNAPAMESLGLDVNTVNEAIKNGDPNNLASQIRAQVGLAKDMKNNYGVDLGIKRKNYNASTIKDITNASSYFDDRLSGERVDAKDRGEHTGGMSSFKKPFYRAAAFLGSDGAQQWIDDQATYDNAGRTAAQKSSNLFLGGRSSMDEREQARSEVPGYKKDWFDVDTRAKSANDERVIDHLVQLIAQEEANGKDASDLRANLDAQLGKYAAIQKLQGVDDAYIDNKISPLVTSPSIYQKTFQQAIKGDINKERNSEATRLFMQKIEGSPTPQSNAEQQQKNYIDAGAVGIKFR